jgi:hypothetical protein
MAKLSDEQVRFLKSQGISLSQVFDGSGLRAKERITKMDALGTPFYYGGAACQAAGHTLRTKPGHCIQCDTAKIAYQLRHAASGHVYIAYSNFRQYAKIGYSHAHPAERIAFLCAENYGTASDWELKASMHLERDAGRKEFEIHALLEQYRKPVTYEKYPTVFVECREIFSCSQQKAIAAFKEALHAR